MTDAPITLDVACALYPQAREEVMDFDITTVRKLTALRNKRGLAFHLKERLTVLLNTAEHINTEKDPEHREKLIASFRRQWAEYVAEGGRD